MFTLNITKSSYRVYILYNSHQSTKILPFTLNIIRSILSALKKNY